jgi:hypothetical protein
MGAPFFFTRFTMKTGDVIMHSYLKRFFLTSVAAFAVLAVTMVGRYADVSLITAAHAEEGHASGHGGSSGGGKGPKYKGGKGGGGHSETTSSHKGSSSHGGGSKTLEDVVFHSDSGHTTGGDTGHKGGSSGKGGMKFMGGGKGGHEEEEGGHEETEGGHEEGGGGETHDQSEAK